MLPDSISDRTIALLLSNVFIVSKPKILWISFNQQFLL